MRWLAGGVVCVLALLLLLNSASLAQEPDFLIVPGQRVGRWQLGVPFDAHGLGRPSWRWEGKGRDIPYYDVSFFPMAADSGLEVRTCRNGGTGLSVLVARRVDQPHAQGEALKYHTAEGIRIGTDEGEVRRLLGRPRVTQGWKERQGKINISVISYTYAGLEIRINRKDRKVFGVGATRSSAWDLCYQAAFGGKVATRRPELTVAGPQGVPLPRGLRIVAPGPGVPPEHAAFSGKWLGTWAGPRATGSHILAVEQITRAGEAQSGEVQSRVIAVWAYNSPGTGRVWERISGTISKELHFTFEGGSFTYRMLTGDVLETMWHASPGEDIYAVMRRMKE